MNKSRINSSVTRHNGDSGYSKLLNGEILRKDHEVCSIFSEIEWLNYSISKLLLSQEIKYVELKKILLWLKENSYSISGFCFMKGDSKNNALTVEFLDELDCLDKQLKEDPIIGTSSEFTIQNSVKYLNLDSIRIIVRDTEREYVAWRNDELIKDFILDKVRDEPYKAQEIVLDIDKYGSFLNRLSSFLWLATRKEAQINGEFDKISTWVGGIKQ